MPQPPILINNFSAGWCPQDDPINGRKNGLLQMDNCELDTNGGLALQGGTIVKDSGFPANAHTLFSRLINGARHDYSALTDGSIYRDTTALAASGGDASNAAFGTAFNFTLIASGNKRIKDSGSGTSLLGVLQPNPPSFNSETPVQTSAIGMIANNVDNIGSSTIVGSYRQFTPVASGAIYVAANQTYNLPTAPLDFTRGGLGTDNDYVQIYTSGLGLGFAGSASLTIDILLTAGNSSGDPVSDFFRFVMDPASAQGAPSVFNIRRSQFTRVGAGTQNWNTVYGYRITVTFFDPLLFGNTFSVSGFNASLSSGIRFTGGADTLFGSYQFATMNVNDTGSYIAKSVLSTPIGPIASDGTYILLDIPANTDAQSTAVWVFARSIGEGLLNQWYRVFATSTPGAQTITIVTGDLQALALDITVNLNLVSIASSSITDKIYDIIGPVNGRWYYFTTNFMYPSDINDPDLVDASIAVRICGSSSELLMWARQINDATILVGTSVDVYTLSGTFATFPDNTIDIYYRPLHCKYPPLTCDADVWGGGVYYMANDGWRMIDGGGNNPSMVSPNLDRLYRGETVQGYAPPGLKVIPRSVRFPIVLAKNKMWCFITGIGTPRIEVYDFVRNYWRAANYGLGDVTAACHTQDGQVIAFYSTDKKIREVGVASSKLIDGSTKQTPIIKTMVFDGGQPRRRKDSYTLKVRLYNTDACLITCVVDGSGTINSVGSTSTNAVPTDQFFDLSQIANLAIVKTYQLILGTGSTIADFLLSDISIDYDLRPEQVTFTRVLSNNYGVRGRKRIFEVPFTIDTLGNNVVVTPLLDNSAQPTLTVNSSYKQTFNWRAVLSGADIPIGKDLEFTLLASSGMFELFGFADPTVIERFPDPIQSYVVPVTNYGTTSRKRLRLIRFILDPLATTVTYTPIIDGVSQSTETYTGAGKRTCFHYFTSDEIGVDFSGTFSASGDFELWQVLEPQPDDIEVFPDSRKFHVIPVTNYGTTSRKRLRVVRFILDPKSANVTFTPIIDRVNQPTEVYSGAGKRTCYHWYTSDQIGVDFSGTFSGDGPYELWEVLQPQEGDIEVFPDRVEYLVVPVTNFGNAQKKRVRVWPFMINTFGSNVTFTPLVDGGTTAPTVFNTPDKQTVRHQFATDVFGVFYSGIFSGSSPFELWEVMTPDSVQVLPIAKHFDQVGPEELFRYGKIRQLEVRLLPFGTSIPYTIYFNDGPNLVGSISVTSGIDATYYIMVPKGTSGNVVRIELGPTTFDFHRFYTRIQVAESGADTENQWITLQ